MEFFVLLKMEESNFEEICRNIFLTTLMNVELYRGYRLKMPIVKDILKNIIKKERQIFHCGDKDIIKIFKDNSWRSNLVNKIYFIIVPSGKYFYLNY